MWSKLHDACEEVQALEDVTPANGRLFFCDMVPTASG